MAHSSKRLKRPLLLLRVLTVFLLVTSVWPFMFVMGKYLSEAWAVLSGALRATTWRAIWVSCRAVASVAISVCACAAAWNFWAVLKSIQRGSICTARNVKQLGRMAVCCVAVAAVVTIMLCFYAWLESTDERKYVVGNALFALILMYIPFTFVTAALVIQGIRVLMMGRRRTVRVVDDPEIIFTLLQVACIVWLAPALGATVSEFEKLHMYAQFEWGLIGPLLLIDKALWLPMLVVFSRLCGRLKRDAVIATKRNARSMTLLASGCCFHGLLSLWRPLLMVLYAMVVLLALTLRLILIDCMAEKSY